MKKIAHLSERPWVHILFLTCLVFLAYSNSFQNGFVSDDRWIREMLPNDLWMIMKMNPTIHLTNVLWWFTYQFFQLSPWPYRLINVLAHLGSTILVYGIVSTLVKRRVGLITASLFAVHPILIESVSWIAGGVYSQSGCVFLLSFYLYVLSDQGAERIQSRKRKLLYYASVFAYGIAILFSEKAIVLFLLFIALEVGKGRLKHEWKRLIPFVLIGLWCALYYFSLLGGRMTGVVGTVGQTTVKLHNPLIQIPTALSMYFQLLFWPDRLSFYQSEIVFGPVSMMVRTIVTAVFFIGWIVSFFFGRRRYFIWFSWFVIPLLPTLTPMPIAWIVAERYIYLSSIGIFVLFSIAYDSLLSKSILRKPLTIIYIFILCCLIGRTMYRNLDWRSEDTMWVATAVTAPSNQFTWNNMGDYYSRRGDFVHAADSFRKSIAIAPGYAPAYYNLAGTLLQMGEIGDAIMMYEKAIAIKIDFWEAYRELGSIYLSKSAYDEASVEFSKGREIYPHDPVMNQRYELLLRLWSEKSK